MQNPFEYYDQKVTEVNNIGTQIKQRANNAINN